MLTSARFWRERLAAVCDWSAWLAEGGEAQELVGLRRNVGNSRFRPVGRPRKRAI